MIKDKLIYVLLSISGNDPIKKQMALRNRRTWHKQHKERSKYQAPIKVDISITPL
jgi:hypothetical protein